MPLIFTPVIPVLNDIPVKRSCVFNSAAQALSYLRRMGAVYQLAGSSLYLRGSVIYSEISCTRWVEIERLLTAASYTIRIV